MRLKLLAFIARLLDIQFKVDGLPYGAPYRQRASETVVWVDSEGRLRTLSADGLVEGPN